MTSETPLVDLSPEAQDILLKMAPEQIKALKQQLHKAICDEYTRTNLFSLCFGNKPR
jgi:hypothetical protein